VANIVGVPQPNKPGWWKIMIMMEEPISRSSIIFRLKDVTPDNKYRLYPQRIQGEEGQGLLTWGIMNAKANQTYIWP